MRYCVVAEQQADSWVELGEATGVRDAAESRLRGRRQICTRVVKSVCHR